MFNHDKASSDEEMQLQQQLLDELLEFARGGMARDMRQRFGKPLPPEEGMEDESSSIGAESEEDIPGVETTAEADGEVMMGGEGESAGPDKEKLRAVLMAMKAKG